MSNKKSTTTTETNVVVTPVSVNAFAPYVDFAAAFAAIPKEEHDCTFDAETYAAVAGMTLPADVAEALKLAKDTPSKNKLYCICHLAGKTACQTLAKALQDSGLPMTKSTAGGIKSIVNGRGVVFAGQLTAALRSMVK